MARRPTCARAPRLMSRLGLRTKRYSSFGQGAQNYWLSRRYAKRSSGICDGWIVAENVCGHALQLVATTEHIECVLECGQTLEV